MNLCWDWFKVFYYIAKEGQISKAAEKLHISQPAVSQTIKLLEESLGFTLFIRKPKGVTLTPPGNELIKHIQQAFNQISLAENKIMEFKNSNNGEIKLGTSDTLCSHYLLNYLKKYRRTNPNSKIHIYNMTTNEIILSLKQGNIDLGFINMPYSVDPDITIREIETLQDCFICGSDYKKYFKKKVNISDIVKHPIILLEEGTNMRRFVNKYFSDNNVQCEPELELGSIDLLTKFTMDNFGISFVTKNFVTNEIKSNEVFVIEVNEKIPKRSIGIIKMKGTLLTGSAQKFYDLF